MYTRLPTAQELGESGLLPADYVETIEVWPENWPLVELFDLLDTQWHHGMNGPTGLRYDVVTEMLDRKGYTGDAWWAALNDIRAMERAALAAQRAT